MRFMTWNCRVGGFRTKSEYVSPFRPDVLVVQEVSPADDVLLYAGEAQPTYTDRPPYRPTPPRAMGVFSYTDIQLASVDDPTDPREGEDEYRHLFRRYAAERGDLKFHVAAVWTAWTKNPKEAYRQAHRGLEHHADWILERPTVILGDLNDNASFKGTRWKDFMELLRPLGYVSAYHVSCGETFGAETRATHYFRGDRTRTFHIDYCFIPEVWKDQITATQVGSYDDWHKISDHVPLIVDVEL